MTEGTSGSPPYRSVEPVADDETGPGGLPHPTEPGLSPSWRLPCPGGSTPLTLLDTPLGFTALRPAPCGCWRHTPRRREGAVAPPLGLPPGGKPEDGALLRVDNGDKELMAK